MDAREQTLLDNLKEANTDLQYARAAFSEARKKLTEAESNVINAKLRVEKLTEELRIIRMQKVVPGQHYSLFDDEG